MNRTKKFMYNTIASVFQQITLMIAGFILPRIILSHYGSVINGLTTSITQFLNYFTMVEAGIGAAAVYSLYKPLSEDDHPAISSIVTAAKDFYIFSGYIFTGLTVIFAFVFPFLRSTSSISSLEIGLLVLILGFSGALDFFTLSKYNVLFTADQRSYVISLASTVATVVNTIIIVIFALNNMNIVLVRAIALLTVVLRSLILIIYAKKHYKYIDYHAKPNKIALAKRWDALYLQILGVVQAGAPVILATIFINYQVVSVYSIFNMVIGGINGILSIFMSGLSASFGDIIARKELKKLQITYKQFEFTYYALLTFVYACAMVLIMPFIQIYTHGIHDANYNVPIIGFLIVLNGFLYNLKTPQGMLVISAGLYRETKLQTTIQGLIALLVGAALTPFYGLAGILVGSILSNLYRDIDLLFFIPSHITKLSPKTTFSRWRIIITEFVLICVPFFLFKNTISSLTQWSVWAIIVAVYAILVICVLSYLLDRTEMKKSIKTIFSMVVKKHD